MTDKERIAAQRQMIINRDNHIDKLMNEIYDLNLEIERLKNQPFDFEQKIKELEKAIDEVNKARDEYRDLNKRILFTYKKYKPKKLNKRKGF